MHIESRQHKSIQYMRLKDEINELLGSFYRTVVNIFSSTN